MIYSPSEDSFLLQKCIKRYSKNKFVLDMGTGSGILGETALRAQAKSVLASDINPESIRLLKKKNIQAVKSDLFSNITGKFDLIVFNPPYLPEDEREPNDSRLATTGGKYGDEIILKFLSQAPSHLNKNGKILLLLSSLTPKDRIKPLLNTFNLSYKSIASKKLFFETLEVWLISQQNP